MVDRFAGQPPRLRIGRGRPSRCHRRHRWLRAPRADGAAVRFASGTSNGMPASLILALARDRRRPIASGLTRKAEAMRIALRPSTVCSISGVCIAASIGGMGADEQQFQPLVAEALCGPHGAPRLRRRRMSGRLGLLADAAWRAASIRAPPRHGQQPGLGIVGNAVARPDRRGGVEGVGKRSLRTPRCRASGREEGEQPAIGIGGPPRSTASLMRPSGTTTRALQRGRQASCRSGFAIRLRQGTGRTSTPPAGPAG